MHVCTYIGVSFARDFLEMEQNTRSDSNYAYELKEFTSKFYSVILSSSVNA